MASKVLKKQGEITPNQISIIYFAEGLMNRTRSVYSPETFSSDASIALALYRESRLKFLGRYNIEQGLREKRLLSLYEKTLTEMTYRSAYMRSARDQDFINVWGCVCTELGGTRFDFPEKKYQQALYYLTAKLLEFGKELIQSGYEFSGFNCLQSIEITMTTSRIYQEAMKGCGLLLFKQKKYEAAAEYFEKAGEREKHCEALKLIPAASPAQPSPESFAVLKAPLPKSDFQSFVGDNGNGTTVLPVLGSSAR